MWLIPVSLTIKKWFLISTMFTLIKAIFYLNAALLWPPSKSLEQIFKEHPVLDTILNYSFDNIRLTRFFLKNVYASNTFVISFDLYVFYFVWFPR